MPGAALPTTVQILDGADGPPARSVLPAAAQFEYSGGGYLVTQLAPAGLWTTAGDLARLLIDLQASAAGKKGHRFRPP